MKDAGNTESYTRDLHGAVTSVAKAGGATQENALQLERSARQRMESDWGVGETGAAGPKGNRYGDAVGHTCIGVSGPVEMAITIDTKQPGRDRKTHV